MSRWFILENLSNILSDTIYIFSPVSAIILLHFTYGLYFDDCLYRHVIPN